MEDKTLSGYAKLEELEYEITGNSSQLSNDKTAQSFQQEFLPADILLESFPEEEIFILSEEYVRMEAEYVLWQETTSGRTKIQEKELNNEYEGQLILPFEDSLQSLNEYFTLRTMTRPIRCN
jgi:competence CoiA-like predicted nuclease